MSFQIAYTGVTVEVTKHDFSGRTVYRAVFPNGNDVFLTKADKGNNKYFWTSVPEGNLDLATDLGRLIDQQLNPEQGGLF